VSEQLTKVDKAKIDLWTAHDMDFMISKKRGVGTIPRFTSCVKPPYTSKIKEYLKWMEEKSMVRPDGNPKAVCVQLEGILRYLWRTDVLTREEYEKVKAAERSGAIGVFGSKSKRAMGKGRAD